jgi:hypothetical protein
MSNIPGLQRVVIRFQTMCRNEQPLSVYIRGPLTSKMAPNGQKRPPTTNLNPNGPPMQSARGPIGSPMPAG